MPKFVSNSSGQIYGSDKQKKEKDEILASLDEQDELDDVKKPSAINRKGVKEKQKSSLDLFKEELRRLNEEQEEQRNKLVKNSLNNAQSPSTNTQVQRKPQAPIPLKPDPRCPTTLTLQVNLNPKDKDAPSNGSFDNGDPTTTNLYIGNLSPTVNENDLCDIFGKFGPLASIKIMWPRTDEERARNRNSGFVAYMSRSDGERALKVLNGMDYRGHDMKLGWGKVVPLPKNPVFIPKELIEYLKPPPPSGMPFNAQLHSSDVERGYKVPRPYPKPIPRELESQISTDKELAAADSIYRDFIQVFQRSTVQVYVPQDRSLLDRIHKTVEFVIQEGPVFESIITARESKNPDYSFLCVYDSPSHIYYRWRLYSILHGDDPYIWSTDHFRMYEGGPLWVPPPLNPFADGMPIEVVERLTGIGKDILTSDSVREPYRLLNIEGNNLKESKKCDTVSKGKLNRIDLLLLKDMLRCLEPTKTSIGAAMLFCINHSDAAEEIICMIKDSICSPEASYKSQIAHLFLISDILNNSSAAVTNASYYREGFKQKLSEILCKVGQYLAMIKDNHLASRFKQKILSVLGAWKYYQLYEDKFVIQLSESLFRSTNKQEEDGPVADIGGDDSKTMIERKDEILDEQLDGNPIDEAVLAECLERKGLSLRWYKTLELSDDESDLEVISPAHEKNLILPVADSKTNLTSKEDPTDGASGSLRDRFKVSKWELVTDEPETSSIEFTKTYESIRLNPQDSKSEGE